MLAPPFLLALIHRSAWKRNSANFACTEVPKKCMRARPQEACPVTNRSLAHPAPPTTEDQDHPHACYEGVIYIGHLVADDDGNEVEVIEAVPCRRCAGEDQLR